MDLGIGGRTALITGGSHGLGRATASALASEGVNVAICGRHLDSLEKAAKEITAETGGSVFPLVADVCDPGDLERLVAATVAEFGSVDILLNNADSASRQAEFFELTDDDWLEKLNVKLFAAIRLVRLVAPLMMERRWGRIISMSGGTTRTNIPYGMPKGVAQAGLINLSKKLSVLLGPHGITVNVVEPGHMWSDGRTVANKSRAEIRGAAVLRAAEQAGISYEEMDRRLLDELVIGRRLEPEDAARVLVFLSSQLAGTITGEVVVANGGESRFVRY